MNVFLGSGQGDANEIVLNLVAKAVDFWPTSYQQVLRLKMGATWNLGDSEHGNYQF